MPSIETAQKSIRRGAPRRQPARPKTASPSPSPSLESKKRTASDDMQTPRKKLRFSLSSPIVKIVAGSGIDSAEYNIHEDLLKQHSQFAVAALSGEWKEAAERVIKLEEDLPQEVEVFAAWLYSGEIAPSVEHDQMDEGRHPISVLELESDPDDSGSNNMRDPAAHKPDLPDPELEHLTKCWILGDKLLSPSFKDSVIDRIIWAKLARRQSIRAIDNIHTVIYSETSESNGLKRLLVDLAAVKWKPRDLESVDDADFLRDVAMRLLDRGTPFVSQPWIGDKHRYHSHGKAEKCWTEVF